MLRRFLLLMGLLSVSGFAWGDNDINFYFKFCAYAPSGYPDATYTIQPVTADSNNTNFAGGWEHATPSDPVIQISTISLDDTNNTNRNCCLNKLTGGVRSISTANPDGSHYQCSDGYFFQQNNKGGNYTQSRPRFNISYSNCALDPIAQNNCVNQSLIIDVYDDFHNNVYVGAGAAADQSYNPFSKSGSQSQNRIVLVPSVKSHSCTVNSYYVITNTSSTGKSNSMSSADCPLNAQQVNYYKSTKPGKASDILTVCIRLDPTTSGSNDY